MRKRFVGLFLSLLFIPGIIKAASASVSISAPGSVYVGDTVSVSVTISSGSSLGSWEYSIGYDDSKLSYVSTTAPSAQSVVGYAQGGGQTSATYTWTFKAISSGEASFNVNGVDAYAFDDDSQMSIGGATYTSISVVKPSSGGSSVSGGSNNWSGNEPDYSYEYSGDNSLSSLVIEGFDIGFDSNVTEYSVSVPNDTKKVKIGATANDSKASVSGIGDYDVKEGSNKIEVKVTAENGDVRTYSIDVVVKEESPIEVKVGDEKFTVIRKTDKLPKANPTYSISSILIKGESVPCYHSDITDIYLVGLMNDKGKVSLYRYLASSDKFTSYNEINIGSLYLILTDSNDIPSGYILGKVNIDNKEYDAYLKDDTYPLLHGINLENGNEGFYSYDEGEKTLQLFKAITSANGIKNNYVFYGLIGFCFFEFIMLIISVISKNKQLRKLMSDKLNTKTDCENGMDLSYNDESNITDDLTDQYLSTSGSSSDLGVSSEENSISSDTDDVSSVEGDSLGDDSSYDSCINYSDDIDVSHEWNSSGENYKEFSDDTLGHTALISRSVNNVYSNSVNRKEDIKRKKASRKKKRFGKSDDDDMFKF